MHDRNEFIRSAVVIVVMVLSILLPMSVWGEGGVATVIEEAKAAIELARQSGAEKKAPDDLAQAKSWLAQAEKEYADSQSILSRTMKLVVTNEAKAREINYLADMARTKARIAETKAKKAAVTEELKEVMKELADYRTSQEVLNKKLAEAAAAKGVQAKAEAELKALEQAKQEVADLEERKKRALQETQQRAAELETLKQKERLEEAQRALAREQELAEAKLKAERMAGEREKMEALQKKMAALEREKAMLSDAAKIPQTTAKSTEQEIVISIPTVNIFTAKNEIHPSGKALLDQVSGYVKKYATGKITVRGYTDSSGKAALNQSLSERRAQKVKEYLVLNRNIPPADVATEGLGPTQPVANNDTEAGRALNRRVEICIPKGQ